MVRIKAALKQSKGVASHLIQLGIVVMMLSACAPLQSEQPSSFIQEDQSTRTPAPLPTLTPPPSPAPRQVISIWLDWEYQELSSLYQLLEQYQQLDPTVVFEITYRPREDLLTAFQAAAAEGAGPSILLGPSQWGPELRDQGYILNLSPLLDPGMESDVIPIAWTQAAEGTQLFGLPLELHGMVLYRNRALAPQPVADLQEWQQVANLLQEEGQTTILLDLGLEVSLPVVAACGVELFNPQGGLNLFNQGGECWLRLLASIGDLGEVVFDSEDEIERFINGQAAWVIASTEMRDEFIEAIGITNLEVDPWPLYDVSGFPLRGFTWSENAYLVAGSAETDVEASWKFLQYLFGEEGQKILSDPAGAGHIPTTSSFDPPDGLMLSSSSMLRVGIPIPLRDRLVIVQEPLLAAIQAVVLQGADPGFALRMAEERLELLLSGNSS